MNRMTSSVSSALTKVLDSDENALEEVASADAMVNSSGFTDLVAAGVAGVDATAGRVGVGTTAAAATKYSRLRWVGYPTVSGKSWARATWL